MNANDHDNQEHQITSEHKAEGFSALASADSSAESSGRAPAGDAGGKVESLARLNISPEELQQAIEQEIDKLFADLAACTKASFHKAILKPITRRDRRQSRAEARR